MKKRNFFRALFLTLGLGLSLAVTTLAEGSGSSYWTGHTNIDGTAFRYVERGVSISRFQNDSGTIDWDRVKADGIDFAIIRVAYGLREDQHFDENIRGAQAAGIKVGAYLCSTAKNMNEAIAEANLTVEKIKQYNLDYPVAFDMEVNSMLSEGATAAELTAMANKYCEIVEKAGYQGMVYANGNWLRNYLIASDIQYDVWYASYNADKVYRPVSGARTTIWQSSEKGTVDGIGGNVTTEFSLKAYGGTNTSTSNSTNTLGPGGAASNSTTVSTDTSTSSDTSSDTSESTNTAGPSSEQVNSASSPSTESVIVSELGPAANQVVDGWSQLSDGTWVYYESSNASVGWKYINGHWYYFSRDAKMQTGWIDLGGKWYYLAVPNGDMKTGWRYIGDIWYYMEESGEMLSDCTRKIDGIEYHFDSSGACTNPYG